MTDFLKKIWIFITNEKEFIWNLFIRWFGFGVFVCFVPILLILLYDQIVGYEFEWDRLSPDFFLAIFAVIGNVMSNEIDIGKFRGQYIRMFFVILSFITLVPCIYFYVKLFDHNLMVQNIGDIQLEDGLLNNYIFGSNSIHRIYTLGIILLSLNGIIGILIEIIARVQQNKVNCEIGGDPDDTNQA